MKQPSVVTVPDKRLSEVAKPVTSFGNELQKQVKLMIKILKSENGVGLAANQIGLNNQVIIIEYNDPKDKESIPLQAFINPEIVEQSDESVNLTEGCLSVPKIELPIIRVKKVKIRAQNISGKKIKLSAKGLLARIIQHETDHLNGILFTSLAQKQLQKNYPNYKKLKIVFIGSGDFSEPILRTLILLDFNIVNIFTEKAKLAGRNNQILSTPVARTAITFAHDYIETDDIKKQTEIIQKLNPDIIVLSDFGQIIPQNILDIPKMGSINIHPSILPKYRGATPIQNVILSGELKTGVSIIKMVKEIDAGPILAQKEIDIFDFDNSQTLKDRLSILGLQMIVKLIPQIQAGKIKAIVQDHKQATLTKKFSKDDGKIDWRKSAQKISRQIRAFHPWPGSYTFVNNKRLIIHQAHLKNNKLILDIVQQEGKCPMSFLDFINGYHDPKPKWFSKLGHLEKK